MHGNLINACQFSSNCNTILAYALKKQLNFVPGVPVRTGTRICTSPTAQKEASIE